MSTPPEPLTQLRRRCTAGAVIAAAAFLAVFVTELVHDGAVEDTVVIGAEIATAVALVLCGLAAVGLWLLTLNAKYALALWSMASDAKDANAARTQEILKRTRDITPAPIMAVRTNGHQRENRRAV